MDKQLSDAIENENMNDTEVRPEMKDLFSQDRTDDRVLIIYPRYNEALLSPHREPCPAFGRNDVLPFTERCESSTHFLMQIILADIHSQGFQDDSSQADLRYGSLSRDASSASASDRADESKTLEQFGGSTQTEGPTAPL